MTGPDVTRHAGVGWSVLAAIGNTPLVELPRFTRGLDGRVLAKLEFLNPGGSKKDRIALRMIEDAEDAGALRPGQPVVELTSGNTGTGLAIVCAVKGYPFVAVMSADPRMSRRGGTVCLSSSQWTSTSGRARDEKARRALTLLVVRDGIDPSTSGFSDRRSTN